MSTKNAQRSKAERAQALLREHRRRERKRNLIVVGSVVAALLVIVGVMFYVQTTRDKTGQTATNVPGNLTGGYSVTVGRASAPTTITIYEDFQCPICHEFEALTSAKLDAAVAAGRAKVDYHMVSFLDTQSANAYSSRSLNAAAVVLDTAGPDVFLKFHNLLFEHQPAEGTAGPTDQQLITYAVQAGADRQAITQPIQDKVYAQWVLNATDQMSRAGINGTPTVFINGQELDPRNPSAAVQAVLAAVQ